MKAIGFDNDKYLSMQSEHIKRRIAEFGGKLYLEFGGKLFDDYHASRVLPGFQPDSKLKLLLQLSDQAEIVIVINAVDIEKNKLRGDLGITYDADVLRLIGLFRGQGLLVSSVVLAQYTGQTAADAFQKRLENMDIRVYHHYPIAEYPSNIPHIVSEQGYGKNDYIETTKPLVVVTAPGPGSGKMATCLSQLYHEHRLGINAGYAKFETFPIWSLSLKHPVNLAYEAATVDLKDVNMIDPYHLDAYEKTAVNYNRDVEIYPVLEAIFDRIYGKSPYKSPTDMGVNMAGFCISDDEVVREACKQEIIRRYYQGLCDLRNGRVDDDSVYRLQLLLKQVGATPTDREVAVVAGQLDEQTNHPAAAIQLPDGSIVTGKTKELLGASAAVLLNSLKKLAGIDDHIALLSPLTIAPIQDLKINYMGNINPRLHTDEVLLALCISAATNPTAALAMEQLGNLRGCEVHSTVMLSATDENQFKKLGMNVTCDAVSK